MPHRGDDGDPLPHRRRRPRRRGQRLHPAAAEARKKPKVSTFLTADHERILELEPDLVLGFSDLQAELSGELIRRGVPVYVFNQRSLAEILQSVRVVAALVGRAKEGERLADELAQGLRRHAARAADLPRRPRVFLEEWHDPLIAGIRWTSELLEIAGGVDICPELRAEQGAKGRIVDAEEIARRDPEAVIASWCGKKVKPDEIRARPGWGEVTAVKRDQLYEIKSVYLLQPGPAALTEGLDQMARIVHAIAHGEELPKRREADARRADLVR